MDATAIFGPPGTGKTTWMMTELENLIKAGYDVKDIMYLSFTKAAAGEVLRRMGIKRSDTVSTIHSACYRLLSLGGSSVVDYNKLRTFGHKIGISFKGNSDDAQETMELGDQYLSIYSLARNREHEFQDTYLDSDRPGDQGQFEFFQESYDDWKDANGIIDFTDMLSMYRDDVKNHGCKVIFIDESQDLSPLQWSVIRGMVDQHTVERVYFAGDDDQAIFEWAGADPHGMAKFMDDYTAGKIVLDKSYRLPKLIHSKVVEIGSRIDKRVEKGYYPRSADGEIIYEELFEPTRQKEGFILARSHSIKQAAERLLIERRIPFIAEGGGLPGPFGCKAAKAIRAWKRYKDTKVLTNVDYEAMVASAVDRVRGDLVAGDRTSILNEDPIRIFKVPIVFQQYFREVDIHSDPLLTSMTIHGSKGREANEVTLITDWPPRVENGAMVNPDAEARVWYVGASRAREKLRVTSLGGSCYDI